MEKKKFVYSFNEGSKDMKDLLGGKGANLAEMTKSAFRYHLDLRLQPKPATVTMKKIRRLQTIL